ncbi:basic proline-rich protein-like [Poecile atricapillus]|uniref:basic proline-rich protein-like n=1 Tax=Poecile atricapillus TaxID=48891 RepID=UPI00273A502F|nr:basic proline-rich protein-like [Poecile atricapillus]
MGQPPLGLCREGTRRRRPRPGLPPPGRGSRRGYTPGVRGAPDSLPAGIQPRPGPTPPGRGPRRGHAHRSRGGPVQPAGGPGDPGGGDLGTRPQKAAPSPDPEQPEQPGLITDQQSLDQGIAYSVPSRLRKNRFNHREKPLSFPVLTQLLKVSIRNINSSLIMHCTPYLQNQALRKRKPKTIHSHRLDSTL